MNERLLDTILNFSKERILRITSVLIWISLIYVSFNKFVNRLDYSVLTSPQKICSYLLSGNYIILIAWFLCLATVYNILKYLFTISLPASSYGMRIFLHYLVPEEYKIPLLNVYFKKAIAVSGEYIKKAIEFWDDETVEKNLNKKVKLDLFTGIILKLIFTFFVVINNFNGKEFWIVFCAIIICVIIAIYLISSTTLVVGKNAIHKKVSEYRNADISS